jgi:1-acyl-sn-glycerol-3-phosphate acyltransferase
MKTTPRPEQPNNQPRVSAAVMRTFVAYFRRYVRRNFHALRILKGGRPPRDSARPLVIYLNHASWWDPLVCLLLSRQFFPDRRSFAPIDAAMLQRYGFFKHLGFFGIEPQTPGGARTFLRTTHALLASSLNAVWLTPQGRFVDVRERPLQLQKGLGVLAVREPGAAFIPLAIEYSFWTERRPEILVSFGGPIVPGAEPARLAADWTRIFTGALETVQNELALRASRRDINQWVTLDRGKSSVSAIYDRWRWLRARVQGEKFHPEHHGEFAAR